MVNYKFKISDMIPNSWFFKLKDISTTSIKSKNKPKKKQPITSTSSSSSSSSSSTSTSTSSVFSSGAPPPQTNKPHLHNQPETHQRKSYYFTRDLAVSDRNVHQNSPPPPPPPATEARLPNLPRKSAKKRRPTNNRRSVHRKSVPEQLITTSTISTGCNCLTTFDPCSDTTSSENESILPDLSGSGHGSFTSMVSSLSCPCRKSSSSDDKFENVDLPPIITKSEKLEDQSRSDKWITDERNQYPSLSVKVVKEDNLGISAKEQRTRKLPGKLKTNNYSPRVGSRVKVQAINGGRRSTGDRRRSIMDSFAVVKTSVDPQKDFKESMVEMIMENKIRGSKELEELLACYLSLNSDEYHDLIIKVFKQIWFENAGARVLGNVSL